MLGMGAVRVKYTVGMFRTLLSKINLDVANNICLNFKKKIAKQLFNDILLFLLHLVFYNVVQEVSHIFARDILLIETNYIFYKCLLNFISPVCPLKRLLIVHSLLFFFCIFSRLPVLCHIVECTFCR